MIPGHPYLSTVIPPEERMVYAVILITCAFTLSYLFIRGIFRYAEWRNAQIKEA